MIILTQYQNTTYSPQDEFYDAGECSDGRNQAICVRHDAFILMKQEEELM
jgi:hypothetical protein